MANCFEKMFGLKPGPKTLAELGERRAVESYIEYSVVLIMDTSESMSGEKLENEKEALISFLQNIDLSENEVGLVAFGGSFQKSKVWTDGLTQNKSYLEKRIKNMKAGGGSPLKMGMSAAHEILKTAKGSPAMVIATDGQPTDAPEEEILKYVEPIKANQTRIITIGIGNDVNEKFLKELASSSEDYHFAKASFELKKIYKKVAAGLAVRGKNA